MDDFFLSNDENQKIKSEEYIVKDVSGEITLKKDEKNANGLKEIEKENDYELIKKRSKIFYYLLIIGCLLLLYFSSRWNATSFKEAFSKYGFIFIISLLFIIICLPSTIIYNMRLQKIDKEKYSFNKKEIQNNTLYYEDILNKENMISSGFIIEFEKKYVFLDCYFYECENKLAFCDGLYAYEIPLDRLTICKNNNEMKFYDNIFEYNSPIIFKNKRNIVTSISNYDIIVEGKYKLHLMMTEYHFDIIKKFLGE